MYITPEALLGCVLATPTYQEGLHTPERHLFYLVIETITYTQQKKEGILDARALLWQPPIIKGKCVMPKKQEVEITQIKISKNKQMKTNTIKKNWRKIISQIKQLRTFYQVQSLKQTR